MTKNNIIDNKKVLVGDIIRFNGDNFGDTYYKKQMENWDYHADGEPFSAQDIYNMGMIPSYKLYDGVECEILSIHNNGIVSVKWINWNPNKHEKTGDSGTFRFDAPLFSYYEVELISRKINKSKNK
jgi:hypothetical protein